MDETLDYNINVKLIISRCDLGYSIEEVCKKVQPPLVMTPEHLLDLETLGTPTLEEKTELARIYKKPVEYFTK